MRFLPLLLVLAFSSAAAQAADITVSAAASLTNAFQDIGKDYEQKYPDAKVRFNFGGSGALLQQIAKGAPVDVFASADQETMDKAQSAGLLHNASRTDFVRNDLVMVVPRNASYLPKRLQDLSHAAIRKIAVGNPASVPVGRYTQAALEKAGWWQPLQPKVIMTQNVRQSLDYVARGEVEAGFVYATDMAVVTDKVTGVMTVPTDKPISYPIAMVKGSAQAAEAQRFVQYIQSPAAQKVLAKHGFRGVKK